MLTIISKQINNSHVAKAKVQWRSADGSKGRYDSFHL